MIRTGQQYQDLIRDGRQVWINGERVKDVTVHLIFRPLVNVRGRIYDMQHDPRFAHALSYCSEAGEVCAVALKLPRTQADWHAKREAVEAVLSEIGGVVTRVGDETVGEMWSLFDGQDILDEVDPAFSDMLLLMSSRRRMPALSCAAANSKQPPPTPTRRSRSRPSPIEATKSFPTMRSVSSETSAHRT